MKKFLAIVLLSLLFSKVSYAENCPEDMKVEGFDQTLKSYVEEVYKSYFVPEESYKFGLEIQEAVKNKDLKNYSPDAATALDACPSVWLKLSAPAYFQLEISS